MVTRSDNASKLLVPHIGHLYTLVVADIFARYNKIAGEQGGVVMPSSFGSIEKVGMQFGSLSLGGTSDST